MPPKKGQNPIKAKLQAGSNGGKKPTAGSSTSAVGSKENVKNASTGTNQPKKLPKKGVNKKKLLASMVNIPSTNKDPYYRYKMPSLEIRHNPSRSRVNPQKETITTPASTVLQNLPAIAKALNRPVEYLTKFFELELEMNNESDDQQRWFKLIGAEISQQELMIVLDKFIRRFVLCMLCKNPETALTIFNAHIMRECAACGMAMRVDRFSKLTRYLLRNKQFGLGQFNSAQLDASKCRFLKEGATTAAAAAKIGGGNASGFKFGIKIATAKEQAQYDNDVDDDDQDADGAAIDNDWKLDSSTEAQAQRRQEELDLITRVEKIMNGGLAEKAVDPYKSFEEFVVKGTVVEGKTIFPDQDEILGKFYVLDLEKEGAIAILERLMARQEARMAEGQNNGFIADETGKQEGWYRSDYPEMVQTLRESLEKEVQVEGHWEESSDDLDSDDSDDDDDDSDDSDGNEDVTDEDDG